MTIAIQFTIAFLISTVVPILVGDLFLPRDALGKQFIFGVLCTLAISQCIFLPFIILQHRFTPYFVVFVLVIGGLCVLSVVKRHAHYLERIKSLLNINNTIGTINTWMICSLLIIGIQLIRVSFGHFFVYADNATYIPIINDIVETDKDYYLNHILGIPGYKETNIKYLFTTYFPYLASISKISGLHPAILLQTLLPIVLTVSLYNLSWHYGLILFKNKISAWMFVLFFTVLVETIGGYDYTFANHAVAGIYFGKKIVFTVLLPYIVLFIVERSSLLDQSPINLKGKDVMLLLVLITGVCAPSLMGTGLAPITLFSMGVVLAFRRKSIIPFLQMIVAMIPSVVFLLMVIHHLYFSA